MTVSGTAAFEKPFLADEENPNEQRAPNDRGDDLNRPEGLMVKFVAENDHAEPGADHTTQQGHAPEYATGNAAAARGGEELVTEVEEKGRDRASEQPAGDVIP